MALFFTLFYKKESFIFAALSLQSIYAFPQKLNITTLSITNLLKNALKATTALKSKSEAI